METIKTRQTKACELMRNAGFHKAIIGDPMAINYLTGIHITPYERYYSLVVDARQETLLMIVPSVDTGCMQNVVLEKTYLDENGPAATIQQVVGVCETLAVEKKYFSMAIGEIFATLDCKVEDVAGCISQLRMYKDEKEIETMQIAANIVDEALAYVFTKIKPGMTESELQMMLLTFMSTYEGFSTEEIIILVQAADNSANPHGASGAYQFKEGDVVLLDFCAYYKGYWSDITRCFFIGHVGHPKLKEIYNIVLEANLAAIAAVKPGKAAKEIDKVARDYITAAGYGEQFMHRTGHGLGLSVHEEPYITGVNDLVLQQGMTFTIEPGIYLAGIGGIRIEDDILVTKDGCITFTSTSKKLEDNIIPIG
ncbi:MAG: Xaa-Pro peptidase family protein [Ruthenibacterium sp.]